MLNNKHLMLVAGETSGDIHAADLVRALKAQDPSLTFSGMGGPCLLEEGVKIYADLTQMAVIGFVEVFRHLFAVKRLFDLFLKKAEEIRPAAVILVDYPGFNLRLARALKKRGIKVIYYISPKVWAWKEGRVRTIKACVDRLLIIFDFEKDFYARHAFSADFVGNPLIDHIKVTISRQDLLKSKGLDPDRPTIGLIPGSRVKEIKNMLPVMVRAAKLIKERIPQAQFLLSKAKALDPLLINAHIRNQRIPIAVVENEFHNCVNACDVCIVTSGTATLETGLLEKPMVIVYKTAWLTSVLVRLFLKIKWVGLVNIIAQKEIAPELIQQDATPENIAERLLAIYGDPFQMEAAINALKDVRRKLGGPGASHRAAQIVLEEIGA